MRSRRPAIVGLSLILLSASLLAARSFWLSPNRHTLTELAATVGSELPFEPRLTGGFLPRSDSSVRRGGTSALDRLSPDARIAIARLEKQASQDKSSRLLGALGVAFLVEGNVDRSIATLENVTSATDNASHWSDLSAAYLVKAEGTPARRIEYLARGLEAAARSLRVRPSNEARFNRALAIEGLSPYIGEADPWTEYLTVERDTKWIAVAKRHVASASPAVDGRATWEERKQVLRSRLSRAGQEFVTETVKRFPEATLEFFDQELLTSWARARTSHDAKGAASALGQAQVLADSIFVALNDPMQRDAVLNIKAAERAAVQDRVRGLAQGYLAYAEGVKRYDADDYPNAKTFFERALVDLAGGKSPYREAAAAELATILYQQRNLETARRELAAVESSARKAGYRTLLGRILWLQGLAQSKQWRLTEALASFREAASCFEAAGERENAVGIYSVIAANLRMLGDHLESWQYIGRTLEGLGGVRKPIRRYLYLYNASLFASSQDLLDAALLFQDAAVREATARGGGPVVEALIQRATILTRRKDGEQALLDLRSADERLHALPEGPLKRYHQAQIDVLYCRASPGESRLVARRGAREGHRLLFDRGTRARTAPVSRPGAHEPGSPFAAGG